MLSEEAEENEKLNYHKAAMHVYVDLLLELHLLQELNRDVNWYNFECRCRHWSAPWTESDPNFIIRLLGVNELTSYNHRVYYWGPLNEATPIPSTILRNEIHNVTEELAHAWSAAQAPYDWAPGGHLYQKLMREGESMQTYERWRTSNEIAQSDAGHRSSQTQS